MYDELCNDGVLLRREALAKGLDDDALRRLVRAGHLTRIRQGAYAQREVWDTASSKERHVLLAAAVMRQYDDGVALSHQSAAVSYGAPDWGLDLDEVHVTHLHGGGGRRAAQIVHHEGLLGEVDVVRSNGHVITTPARTVHDTVSLASVEAGVVVASWFLNQELTTTRDLELAETSRARWPGTLTDRLALRLADGRFASVGESRSAFLFWRHGLPKPDPQYEIFHPHGLLAGRVDFAWPDYGVICEFDGLRKYLRPWVEGMDPAAVVVAEKRREDVLREITGWRIVRLIWADLASPERAAARIEAVLRRVA